MLCPLSAKGETNSLHFSKTWHKDNLRRSDFDTSNGRTSVIGKTEQFARIRPHRSITMFQSKYDLANLG